MTDQNELDRLISRMRTAGATVDVSTDSQGHYRSIKIFGIKGIGPFPMAPIAAAEHMRDFLEG